MNIFESSRHPLMFKMPNISVQMPYAHLRIVHIRIEPAGRQHFRVELSPSMQKQISNRAVVTQIAKSIRISGRPAYFFIETKMRASARLIISVRFLCV